MKLYNGLEFPKDSLKDTISPKNYPQICGHLVQSTVIMAHNNYQVDENTIIYIGNQILSPSCWGEMKA